MYKILSVSTLIPMQVAFAYGDDPLQTCSVSVDARNKAVYMADGSRPCISLEQAILDHIRPVTVEAPEIPQEILSKIQQVRAGYRNQFPGCDQ